MKNVAIFEDGKLCRGRAATLVKRGNKRVLIEFLDYDYETGKEFVVCEWFKVFIPFYAVNKGKHKYNNKRNYVSYCHEKSNMFYSDYYQGEDFKSQVMEIGEDYFLEIYGD